MSAKPTGSEVRSMFLRFFEQKGHKIVHSSSLVPAQRSHAAVHQRRHEPVQGRVPGHREARLHARYHLAEMRARRRQAQRSGERRLHQSPPHVLRDAGQFQLRRLLQERRHRLRVGAGDLAGVVRHRPKDKLYATIFKGEQGVAARRRGLSALDRDRACRPSAFTRSA